MTTAIIDYGMGNLLSVQRAFEKCDSEAVIISDPSRMKNYEKFVLPGVGAFYDAMCNLNLQGWTEAIKTELRDQDKTLLGICLGMQLLADEGHEVQVCNGLGLIRGTVEKLIPSYENERIPHVGWNDVIIKKQAYIYDGISNETNYYFVHSYHFHVLNEEDIASTTPYCNSFVSAVERDNICGVQFHPEKSQKAGFKLIRNYIEM